MTFTIETPEEALRPASDPTLDTGLKVFAGHRDGVALALGVGLDPKTVDLLAQSLWTSLHGLVSLLIARPAFPWADRERLIESHIRRLLW